MRTLSLLLGLLVSLVFCADLEKVIEARGAITDIVHRDGKLYVSTELGRVEVYDLLTGKREKELRLPDIKDFTGEDIPPKVFSTDISPSGKLWLIVAQGSGGYREVFLLTAEGGLKKILTTKNRLMLSEGRFVSEDKVVLSLISDEIILFDLNKLKSLYRVQVGMSSLSDIALSEDRSKVAVSDESGVVSLVSLKDGSVVRRLKGVNVDKLYKLDYKRDTIMVGGRDRRVGIYYLKEGKSRRIDAEFLVFSVAMDREAKLGAFPFNESNDIKVIEVRSGRVLEVLKGQSSTVSVLLLLKERLIVGCDDGKIFVWRLKR